MHHRETKLTFVLVKVISSQDIREYLSVVKVENYQGIHNQNEANKLFENLLSSFDVESSDLVRNQVTTSLIYTTCQEHGNSQCVNDNDLRILIPVVQHYARNIFTVQIPLENMLVVTN